MSKPMLSISTWKVDGEVFTVKYVSTSKMSKGDCADVNWGTMEIHVLKGQPPATTAKRISHELAHARGFNESQCTAVESIVGLLIEQGVIIP